ncbi:MAG: SAM-dependent methyltransferase [Lachnospiraceae bacterium]|nr:SAM-dependent methyltransferase [Lachnospiraceae bacterium]
MLISHRLKCIADCVKKGNITADIGCDHGFTSIYLVENNISPKVYALDINKGPLSAADSNIKRYGMINRIETRLSDGIKALTSADKVNTILISGMGGKLITSILNELDLRDDINGFVNQLVLSPQSDIYVVRHFLHNHGYTITYERMVYEQGKYYNIICAEPGEESYSDELDYIYGKYLNEEGDRLYIEYMNGIIEKKLAIINKLHDLVPESKDASYKESIKAKTKELEHEVENIRVYLNNRR